MSVIRIIVSYFKELEQTLSGKIFLLFLYFIGFSPYTVPALFYEETKDFFDAIGFYNPMLHPIVTILGMLPGTIFLCLIFRGAIRLLVDGFLWFFTRRLQQLITLKFKFVIFYIINIILIVLWGSTEIKDFIFDNFVWWLIGIISLLIVNIGEYLNRGKQNLFDYLDRGNSIQRMLSMLLLLTLTPGIMIAVLLLAIVDVWEIVNQISNIIKWL